MLLRLFWAVVTIIVVWLQTFLVSVASLTVISKLTWFVTLPWWWPLPCLEPMPQNGTVYLPKVSPFLHYVAAVWTFCYQNSRASGVYSQPMHFHLAWRHQRKSFNTRTSSSTRTSSNPMPETFRPATRQVCAVCLGKFWATKLHIWRHPPSITLFNRQCVSRMDHQGPTPSHWEHPRKYWCFACLPVFICEV